MSRKQMREASRDVNEKASAGPSAWSKKMLDKMGWKEGQGLGKQSDGMAEPVKVVKKDDNSGIGMKAQQSVRLIEGHENDWWSREFAASAARLNALGGGSDSDDSSDSSDSDDDVSAAAPRADPSKPMTSRERDLELFRACGGRQLGMRARGAQKGKLKRSEDSNFGAVHGTGNGAASPPPKKKRKSSSSSSSSSSVSSSSGDIIAVEKVDLVVVPAAAAAAKKKKSKKSKKKSELKEAATAEETTEKSSKKEKKKKKKKKEKKKKKKKSK